MKVILKKKRINGLDLFLIKEYRKGRLASTYIKFCIGNKCKKVPVASIKKFMLLPIREAIMDYLE